MEIHGAGIHGALWTVGLAGGGTTNALRAGSSVTLCPDIQGAPWSHCHWAPAWAGALSCYITANTILARFTSPSLHKLVFLGVLVRVFCCGVVFFLLWIIFVFFSMLPALYTYLQKDFLGRNSVDILVTSTLLLLFTWFLQALSQINELSNTSMCPFCHWDRG